MDVWGKTLFLRTMVSRNAAVSFLFKVDTSAFRRLAHGHMRSRGGNTVGSLSAEIARGVCSPKWIKVGLEGASVSSLLLDLFSLDMVAKGPTHCRNAYLERALQVEADQQPTGAFRLCFIPT